MKDLLNNKKDSNTKVDKDKLAETTKQLFESGILNEIKPYMENDESYKDTKLFLIVSGLMLRYLHHVESMIIGLIEEDPRSIASVLCNSTEKIRAFAYQYILQCKDIVTSIFNEKDNRCSTYPKLDIFSDREVELEYIKIYLAEYVIERDDATKALQNILTVFKNAKTKSHEICFAESSYIASTGSQKLGYTGFMVDMLTRVIEYITFDKALGPETAFYLINHSGFIAKMMTNFILHGTDYKQSIVDLVRNLDEAIFTKAYLSSENAKLRNSINGSVSKLVSFHDKIPHKDFNHQEVKIQFCVSEPCVEVNNRIDDEVVIDKADFDGFWVFWKDQEDYKDNTVFADRITPSIRNLMLKLAYFTMFNCEDQKVAILPSKIEGDWSRMNTMFSDLFTPYLDKKKTPFVGTEGFKVVVTLDHPEYIRK